MKGYLTTCDGAQFELPTLLKWEFSYTGSVPSSLAVKRTARRSTSAIAGSYAHLSVKLSHGTLPV